MSDAMANDLERYLWNEQVAWIAIVTTIGGSIAAYAAANRYEFQATSYYATAQELLDLKHSWLLMRDKPDANWSAFVRRCEDVISAENQAWMAKLLQDSGEAQLTRSGDPNS